MDVAWVPGAMEIPLIAQRLAASKKYDAVICLGAVIRGSTPHFDYVAGEVATGVARVQLDTGIPVIFGVLTTESIEQAVERAGPSRATRAGRGCVGRGDGELVEVAVRSVGAGWEEERLRRAALRPAGGVGREFGVGVPGGSA